MERTIACTLTPGEYRGRVDDLARLAARALRSRERTTDGERLTFDDSVATERDLRAAVAAEAACCPFLRMDLRRAADGLVLEIAAPEEARPVIEELFA